MKWDAILGWHVNPLTCGVAKFNAELARRLGVRHGSLSDPIAFNYPLVSVKGSEHPIWLGARQPYDLLIHDEGAEIPWLIEHAEDVWDARILGCPATLSDTRPFSESPRVIASFGMAHKLRLDCYQRLAELAGQDTTLMLSAALHEGTRFDGRFEAALADLGRWFSSVYFLGYLSDVALANLIRAVDVCACFFTPAVRANNTSVHAAMQLGTPVVTNLDDWSPKGFVHGETVFDLNRLEKWPARLRRVSAPARLLQARDFSWEVFLAKIQGEKSGHCGHGRRLGTSPI